MCVLIWKVGKSDVVRPGLEEPPSGLPSPGLWPARRPQLLNLGSQTLVHNRSKVEVLLTVSYDDWVVTGEPQPVSFLQEKP